MATKSVKKSQSLLDVTLEIAGQEAQGPKEADTKFLLRLTRSIAKLSDDDFDELPEQVQDWFNEAADAVNVDDLDNIPAFPGMEPTKAAPAAKAAPAKGKGKAAEVDDDDEDDDDGDGDDAGGETVEPDELQEGDYVVVNLKRGGTVEGEVVDVTSRALVMIVFADDDDEEGSEQRINLANIDTVSLLPAGDDGDEDEEEEPTPKKPGRKPGGVGRRVREVLASDPEIDDDNLLAALEDEGLEFNESTVLQVAKDAREFYQLLQEAAAPKGKAAASAKPAVKGKKAPPPAEVDEDEEEEPAPKKRGPGRPAKAAPAKAAPVPRRGKPAPVDEDEDDDEEEEAPKKRGRPAAAGRRR